MSATPSAQYRLTIRVRMDGGKGILGQVMSEIVISGHGAHVDSIETTESNGDHSTMTIVEDTP